MCFKFQIKRKSRINYFINIRSVRKHIRTLREIDSFFSHKYKTYYVILKIFVKDNRHQDQMSQLHEALERRIFRFVQMSQHHCDNPVFFKKKNSKEKLQGPGYKGKAQKRITIMKFYFTCSVQGSLLKRKRYA